VVVSETRIDNDELAQFVTSTLNGIARGVETATSSTKTFAVPGKVAFEIAVKAVKTTGGSGGLKLQVFSAEGKTEKQDEEISRVSFDVIATAPTNWGPSISIPGLKTVV
jgi:hypothetical protein